MNSNQNKVELIINSEQRNSGDINRINSIAEGKYYRKSKKDYIIYKEKDLEGLDGIITNLRIESDRIIMKRSGDINTRFEFIEDEETTVKYICSAGILNMKLLTSKIDLKRNDYENIERISINYLIEFDNGEKSFNNIEINISY